MGKNKLPPTTAHLPADLKEKLVRLATLTGKTQTEIIIQALREHLEG